LKKGFMDWSKHLKHGMKDWGASYSLRDSLWARLTPVTPGF
jgi:hypothetical protein